MKISMSSVAPIWNECRVQKFTPICPLTTPTMMALAMK